MQTCPQNSLVTVQAGGNARKPSHFGAGKMSVHVAEGYWTLQMKNYKFSSNLSFISVSQSCHSTLCHCQVLLVPLKLPALNLWMWTLRPFLSRRRKRMHFFFKWYSPCSREDMLAWIELGTAFVILGIALISLYQALRRCRSNNNGAPPETELQPENMIADFENGALVW